MSLRRFFERFRKEFLFFAIFLTAFLGVLLGSGVAYKVGAVATARYEKLDILAKVLYLIENNYVRDVDEKELVYGAVNGMLATLDPHSTFLPPTTYKEMKVETQGKFSGIGIEIALKEDTGLTVVSPIEDTPAFRAGLQAGDSILSINGEMTRDLGLADAVTKMRGPKGTKVKLLIMREGFKEPKEFVIPRDTIRIQSVKYRALEPGYGYVRITNFQESTHFDLNKALENLRSKNGPIKGLVLDLRNNPGGLLDQAIKVTDTFISSGKIVITKGRNQKQIKVEEAHSRDAWESFPMIVLVNGGSASAAEIVAGALQDNGRAVVLGTKTFGKGTVQTVVELEDGSGLKLTVARYFTPSGRDIQEKGILPDIIVDSRVVAAMPKAKPRRMLREADLRGHLRNSSRKDEQNEEEKNDEPAEDAAAVIEGANSGEDVQLKAAVDFLKTWDVFKNHAVNKVKSQTASAATGL